MIYRKSSICISEAIQKQYDERPNIVTRKIHGCNETYFDATFNKNEMTSQIYYMGKIDIQHKCLDKMLKAINLTDYQIDVFGIGKDLDLIIKNKAIKYMGKSEDPMKDLKKYGIYVSFSHLEGVCTATVEALLMHKKAILVDAPCNEIFKKYHNTYFFKSEKEFVNVLNLAIKDPSIRRDPMLSDFRWDNCNKVFYRELQKFM